MTDTQIAALIEAVEAGRADDFGLFARLGHEGLELALGLYTTRATAGWNAYRGSLDAAKALHEALLPGWMLPCIVSHYLNGKHGVTVELYERVGAGEAIATHDDMARAWLLAILRAHQSQQETGQ